MLSVVDGFIEVRLKSPEDFLKVKETLERIGVASRQSKILYQSCHILHKQGRYFIVHFKEMFKLDGRESSITENDIARRNRIAALLRDWKLVELVNPELIETSMAAMSHVKVIRHSEKPEWRMVSKYTIGKIINDV
jgi:hypothetical protein